MKPLSEAKLTFFSRLLSRKHRSQEGLFLAHGWKLTHEALASSWGCEAIIVRDDLASRALEEGISQKHLSVASSRAFDRLSDQEQPEGILAVVRIPERPEEILWKEGIVLDGIQDPGNAGTIIRLADWCGIPHVYCLDGTVDPFSPKVVRASMGSIFRVPVFRVNAADLLISGLHIFLADLEGTHLPTMHFPDNTVIVIGNESAGVSDEWPVSIPRVTIPRIGQAESLNAAMAAAMLCYRWKLES